MGLLYFLSFGAILVAFLFITLSLASGLLYVSELIEEHTRLAKIIGQRGIYVIIVLHAILYFSDALPLPQTAFSILCHVVYLQNFSNTWPVISLTSWSFMASCVLVIIDHFMWFSHFARVSQDARHTRSFRGAHPSKEAPGFAEVSTFFGVCVWAAPLFLFLSLSANDNALPTSGSTAGSEAVAYPSQPQNRVSLIRSLLPFRSRGTRQDGLLTPHTPRSPVPSGLRPPQSPKPYSTLTPPRSPRHTPADFDAAAQQATNFQLGTPPRRTAAAGTGGLGQRRSILPQENVFGSE
ncbi:hypothetical protein HMN09_01283900 [Mycena chlorophos]|uniref:DUF396-domain-containing protein n=1 Tax=Mycena chlorophos TaxID=658473 RepID=A0A8H6VT61_MYCCL|nr:hypothetical protein HMN09_01283900 [Mycena chlorophos]